MEAQAREFINIVESPAGHSGEGPVDGAQAGPRRPLRDRLESVYRRQGTLLGEAVDAESDVLPIGYHLRLGGEAFAATVVGLYLMCSIEPVYGGVLSLFLAAATLGSRVSEVLKRNKEDIWNRKKTSFEANRRSASSYLALFLGMLFAYLIATVWLGPEGTRSSFEFALRTAGIGRDSIGTRVFGSFSGLLGHNLTVLATFLVLAFIYRSYGALLALGWNAAVWAIALTEMVRRGVGADAAETLMLVAGSAVALLPHLILEATGYVLAALAGTFLSLGVSKYPMTDKRFFQVARASGTIILAGGLILTLAAIVESAYAPTMLRLLVRS